MSSATANPVLPPAPARRLDRSQAIRLSLRTFVSGLFAPLPGIGLLLGLHAIICWARVRSGFRYDWNPAARYLWIGFAVAFFGLCAHLILIASIIVSVNEFSLGW